ncbi:MAG: hypothetical protein GXY83_08075 [Rhodopirellula sp.]|nr:hypothetical protein [Rhodopirellula sp.]
MRSLLLAAPPGGADGGDKPADAPPRTFYVDPEDGRDGNNGLSADHAWQSLERVNSAELKPGDTVRLKCGGQWRGSLTPLSGDPQAPITYTSYGKGPKPLLLGSRPRSRREDWTEVQDGIWATLPLEFRRGEKITDLGRSEWRHHQEAGAKITLTHEENTNGLVVRVACANSGQRSNHVQLWGPKVPVEKGTSLDVSFRARSNIPFRLSDIAIHEGAAPWTRFAAGVVRGDVTTDWQDFQVVLQPTESSTTGHLHINLGGILPDGAIFEFQSGSAHVVTPSIADPLDVDVGNIIFDHGKVCGWKKWSIAALDQPYDYYYDGPSGRVFLCATANPATLHDSIECAMKRHVIHQSNTHDVVYDGLAVMYGAAHGFGGGNTRNLVIRNCDLGYIGGGHQLTRPDGVPVRFGNAIEFWGAASDHLVENCRIWEVYDAALTNQNNSATVRQENIVYRNNVIWNCEYSFEYWNHPETSVTRNIRFVNNTCVHAGVVWSHAQRPDRNGSHLMLYSNTAATSGFEVKYNVFCNVTDWGSRYTGGWKTLPEMSHNLWFSTGGVMTNWFGKPIENFQDYQKTTGLDSQSRFTDPMFLDPAHGNYRLAPDSPARAIRPDGGPIGAEMLWK